MPTNDVYKKQIFDIDPDFIIEGLNNAKLGKALTDCKIRSTELLDKIMELDADAKIEGINIPGLVALLNIVSTPENKKRLDDKEAADKAIADKKIEDAKEAKAKKIEDAKTAKANKVIADKAEADKAAADNKAAVDKAAADKKFPFYINAGKSITCKKGILDQGREVRAEYLGGGQKALNALIVSKHVCKS